VWSGYDTAAQARLLARWPGAEGVKLGGFSSNECEHPDEK